MEKDLALILSDSFASSNACSQNVVTTQQVNIDCSPSKIIEYRTSKLCMDAIKNRMPNMTQLCNPCSITNSTQTLQTNLSLNCGADIQTVVQDKAKTYLDNFLPKYYSGANVNMIDIKNEIITKISDKSFLAMVNQSIIQNQNISTHDGHLDNQSQIQQVDLILNAVSKLGLNKTLESPISNQFTPDELTKKMIDAKNDVPYIPSSSNTNKKQYQNNYSIIFFVIMIFIIIIVKYANINNVFNKKNITS